MHSNLKSKNTDLEMEFSHAVLGETLSDEKNKWCEAQKDRSIMEISEGIDFIFLCDYTPFMRIIPLNFKTIYPNTDYSLRQARPEVLNIEKEIINLFSDQQQCQ